MDLRWCLMGQVYLNGLRCLSGRRVYLNGPKVPEWSCLMGRVYLNGPRVPKWAYGA